MMVGKDLKTVEQFISCLYENKKTMDPSKGQYRTYKTYRASERGNGRGGGRGREQRPR